jgi:hypothetical protein
MARSRGGISPRESGRKAGRHDIVEARHRLEHPHQLEGPRDAEARDLMGGRALIGGP